MTDKLKRSDYDLCQRTTFTRGTRLALVRLFVPSRPSPRGDQTRHGNGPHLTGQSVAHPNTHIPNYTQRERDSMSAMVLHVDNVLKKLM